MIQHKKDNTKQHLWMQVSSIPSKIRGMLFELIFVFLVICQIITQWSCMDTLLPICVPWMYYQWVVLSVFVLSFIVNPVRKYFRKAPISDYYEWILAAMLIIVPAIIFIPNRYIPLEHGTKTLGKVIDSTSAPVNKSPSSNRNYVKIKLNNENTSFWFCLYHDTKPLDSRCVITVKRGVFGMRYVEDVDFHVNGEVK